MTATLYDLASFRESLDAILADAEGEITPEQEAQLDAIEGAFSEKAENVALYVTEQLALADAIRTEEAKLAARRRGKEARADWLKKYLQAQMERVGKTRVDGLLKTISLQNNPPSVVALTPLDDNELRNIVQFAPEYVRHEESWALDKKSVLAAHKAGTLDPDIAKRVQIVQTQSLRIR